MGLVNWILNKWVIPNLDYIFFTLLFPGGTLHWLAEKLYINFFEYGTRQPIKSTTNEINDWENPSVVGRRRRRMRSFSRTFYHSKKNALLYWNMRRSGNRDHDELQEQLLCEAVYMLTGPPGKAQGTAQWDFLLVEDPYSLPVGWEIFNDAFSRDGDALESLSDRDPLLKKSNSFTDIRRANKEWIKMSLPCHWQLQEGVHDIPIYTNTTYPIQFDPPRARRTGLWKNMDCDIGLGADQRPYNTSTSLSAWEPDGVNATGLYRRKFSLPRTWEGGGDRFFLVFEGVDSCMTVWLDGNCVGYSQDSCLSAEFEITDAIASAQSFGMEHMLAVRVSRWCDGTYLEDQDKWWLSGIYREVYIVRRPKVFISDLEFSTPSINFTNQSGGTTAQSASVSVSVMLEGAGVGSLYGNGGMQLGVRADLIDMSDASSSSSSSSGRSVLVMTSAVSGTDHRKYCFASRNNADAALNSEAADLDVPAPAENAVVLLSGSISNPSLWTAETPHLYTLVISLHSSHQAATDDSDVLHVESCRVAVRKIHIDGSQNTLQVNNASIIVAGINRHEFSAESGRAVSLESMRQDALLIKSLNFNAVRTSHYPNHPYWLELCDEVGLFVIDEANIETHGFQTLGQPIGYLANLPEWTAAFGSRVTRMYERDKNFACVIGWSLGNESGFGKAHTGMSTWLRLRDPSRFVQYESGGARTTATDVICPMYVRPDWCRKESVKDKAKRPVILCEYAHAMGNSGGSLGKYWKDFRDPNLPRFQGGFIWDFCDQGLNLRSRSIYNYVHGTNGRRAYGYGGDFDDLPNTKQFCCNGIVGPDRYLYPTAYEVTYLQAPLEVSLHCSEGISVSRGPSYTNVYDARSGLHISSKGIEPNILIKNCRFHSSLSDVELVITLCYYHPILLHNRQKAVIDFPLISFPCSSVSLGPGGFHNLSLLQYITTALQSTADAFSQSGKGAISSELAAFLETYGADNAAESWLDISARVAEGQEIYHTSLSNALLHTLVSQSLASSVLLYRSLCKRIAAEKPSRRTAPISFPMIDTVACEKSDEEGVIIIRWSSSGCSARVGLSCGRLLSWSSPASGEVLCEPVDLCLYRAGTDNDRGGGPFSYYTRWKELGLDSLSRKVERKAGAVRSFFVRPTDGAVVVSASWTLVNNTVEPSTALTAANKKSSPLAIPCQATYVFFPNGGINVRIAATPPSSSLLPPLPRFGLKLALPCDYGSASWFGLGPHEAYPDRQAGVYMGHFRKTVEELHTPYVFPQECGRRADPRWVIFENEMLQHCVGMFPTHTSGGAGPHRGGWGFSASRYSLEALERTPHDFELQDDADRRVHVHLDSHMMGLGGFDSWSPNVESEFLLPRDRELVVDVTFMSFPSHGK